MANENIEHDDRPAKPSPLSSVWEGVIAAIGGLLMLSALGFLFYEALWGNNSPPDIKVEVEQILDSGDDYLVKFRALNEGGQTAAGVQVLGTLMREGRQIEQVQATLDYVPAGSDRRGGLYFRHDPRKAELNLHAAGYQTP